MVVVPTIFIRTVVPTNVVGTTVQINSLKIGEIKNPVKVKESIIGGDVATFTEC